jgi:hypothetical protein
VNSRPDCEFEVSTASSSRNRAAGASRQAGPLDSGAHILVRHVTWHPLDRGTFALAPAPALALDHDPRLDPTEQEHDQDHKQELGTASLQIGMPALPGASPRAAHRSPLHRSPLTARRFTARRSPLHRSPLTAAPLHRSPLTASPLAAHRCTARRSPLHRSPLTAAPLHRSPLTAAPLADRRPTDRTDEPRAGAAGLIREIREVRGGPPKPLR